MYIYIRLYLKEEKKKHTNFVGIQKKEKPNEERLQIKKKKKQNYLRNETNQALE